MGPVSIHSTNTQAIRAVACGVLDLLLSSTCMLMLWWVRGSAVKDAEKLLGIQREDVFMMSMVPREMMGYNLTKRAVMASLDQLQVDYIDLVMFHHRAADISAEPLSVRSRQPPPPRASPSLFGSLLLVALSPHFPLCFPQLLAHFSLTFPSCFGTPCF